MSVIAECLAGAIGVFGHQQKKYSSGKNFQAYEEDWILSHNKLFSRHIGISFARILIHSLREKLFLSNLDFRCYVIFNIFLLLFTTVSETAHAILFSTFKWLSLYALIYSKQKLFEYL